MGFNTRWRLIDYRAIPGRKRPFSEWLRQVRESRHVENIRLPVRHDLGFWLAMNEWRHASNILRPVVRRDPSVIHRLRRLGALPVDFKPTLQRLNALDRVVSVFASDSWARKERAQVLKTTGTQAEGSQDYTLLGPTKVGVLPVLAGMAKHEILRDPERFDGMLKTVNEQELAGMLELLLNLERSGKRILVSWTV
jgi:hypothetical protein